MAGTASDLRRQAEARLKNCGYDKKSAGYKQLESELTAARSNELAQTGKNRQVGEKY